MDLITVRDLFKNTEKYAGAEVNVGGWVRNRRGSKQFGFIVLNDGTYFTPVQVVYNDTLENFQEISKINIGAALIIRGTLVLTPDSKQPFEIQAEQITVEGPSTGDYPLQPKRHSMEFLRTINHLRPRTNTFQAVFRVRSLAAMAIHQFFQDRDFVYVHTPLITGSDCEGAGEMFQVTTLDLNNVPKTEDGKVDYTQDFFGKPTNLTVSGQLNGETFAMAFRNIYTFGPTFRAENSNTTRHAAEFWMIEPEIAFADLSDDMRLAEDMIKYIISYVLEHAPEEMAFFNQFVDKGLLEAYQSPNLSKTPDTYLDPTGTWNPIYVGCIAFACNADWFAEKGLEYPTSWEDLLKPEFKGEIIMAHPATSGTAYTVLATLVQLKGDDQVWDYLEKLNTNMSQYTKSGSAAPNAVAIGEAAIALTFSHDALQLTPEGYHIELSFPTDGTGYEVGAMALIKGGKADEQENAKKFIDWMTSEAGQGCYAENDSFRVPTNTAAPVADGLVTLDEVPVIDYDAVWAASVKSEYCEQFENKIATKPEG